MDTKWKNRKNVISFVVFFLGVSLVLENGISILKNMPGGMLSPELDSVLEEDYQRSRRFQEYICGRLELFLSMAANSLGSSVEEGYYYDYYDEYGDILRDFGYGEEYSDPELEQQVMPGEAGGGYADDAWESQWNEWGEYIGREWKPLTEEQRRKIAGKYHERMEGDKNLLYTISYDGEVLYSNTDLLKADGNMEDPEGMSSQGYNFLLCCDGEKVQVVKDGKEVDIYGDGYYREESGSWYVPGYRNFQVAEEMKKARISVAVAREPLLYTESIYGKEGYQTNDNTLYWLACQSADNQKRMRRNMAGLAAGVMLLLTMLIFPVREGKRETQKIIARIQGKIWVECKVILLLALIYLVLIMISASEYGYELWQEITYHEYMYDIETICIYGREFLGTIPPLSIVLLFWGIYFSVNDLRSNRKIWKHGLIAKVYRSFSAKGMNLPLSRKIAFRSAVSFGSAAVCTILTAGAIMAGTVRDSMQMVWAIVIVSLLCFLAVQYFTGKKNMEAARDMEILAERISDIRCGNYQESGREEKKDSFADHDLKEVMEQLEDIRHGMAAALDDQMKSERMKVELIANVSHDIKTPLTSIISYVQFLKQEENLPEHIKDYVKILDDKSQRLKNMVQDVFAVSKAASGELPLHMEEIDFRKLLCQTMADMEEQIRNSKVTFRTELTEKPVMIMADGQRMYRVFQNLFQNAIQYSLDGSRVYVTLKEEGTLAVASIKNTSQMELDKDKDFTERFARGDQSRTDGGSGLGLSIAQTFTEACGGTFHWETNADLFVVTVSFQTLQDQ